MLLRNYLYEELSFSHRLVKQAKSDDGEILINGEKKTVRYRLEKGDQLTIRLPDEKISPGLIAEQINLSILYEDDDLMVIEKKAGMPTIPSRLHPRGTIANALLNHYAQKKLPYTVHIVTRLDKDTSGVLLVAKHQYSHSLLSELLQAGKIKRKYLTCVEGRLVKKSGKIEAPIARKEGSIIERTVASHGQQALTYYNVVKQCQQMALVDVEIKTGRTHQIRVHFSHIGHPVVGDDLYGAQKGILSRQALHCSEISFYHPFKGEYATFTSRLPDELNALIKQ